MENCVCCSWSVSVARTRWRHVTASPSGAVVYVGLRCWEQCRGWWNNRDNYSAEIAAACDRGDGRTVEKVDDRGCHCSTERTTEAVVAAQTCIIMVFVGIELTMEDAKKRRSRLKAMLPKGRSIGQYLSVDDGQQDQDTWLARKTILFPFIKKTLIELSKVEKRASIST